VEFEIKENPEIVDKQSEADKFFEHIEFCPYSDPQEFKETVKIKFPDWPDEEINQTKGVNFEHNGIFYILMKTDVFPEKYLPYLETHEKWELYLTHKSGFNLFKQSCREYEKDKGIKLDQEKNVKKYRQDVSIYNYDFRHEYAIYKEYQHAAKDGKLDEYHNWFIDLRKTENQDQKEHTTKLIENDTRIRQSVYHKLKEGTPHYFTRK